MVLKSILFVTVLLITGGILHAQEGTSNEEINLSHKLTAVKVYAQMAENFHTAEQHLAAGIHTLVFSGLSQHINNQTFQVAGQGEGIIQEVSMRTSYLNRTSKTARMKAIEDTLKIMNFQMNTLIDQSTILEHENKLLIDHNKLGGEEIGFTAAELEKLTNLVMARMEVNKKAWRIIQEDKSKLTLIIQKYSQEFSKLKGQRDEPTKEVIIKFYKETAGKITLTLRYMVGGASWSPIYDIRCNKINEPIEINLKGKLVNNTGFDWKKVDLFLSTSNPTENSQAPVLYPIYLYLQNPIAYKKQTQNQLNEVQITSKAASKRSKQDNQQDSEPASAGSPSVAAAPPPPDLATPDVTSNSNSLATEYTINAKYDIPSDGQEHLVEIKKTEMPAAYRYFSVPKKDKSAFLQLQLTEWNTYDLIPGPANVYFEGSYISKTYIDPNSANDTLFVGLGKDNKVAIERTLNKKYTSQKTFGSNIKLERSFKINIRNNKTEPIFLTLEDQIPLTTGDKISVDVTRKDGGKYNSSTGKIIWEIDLSPGQTKTLDLEYEIRYPKGFILTTGGDSKDY